MSKIMSTWFLNDPLRGCKNIKGQAGPSASGSRRAELAIFFATFNFDLKYVCSLLTYKNVKYLILKI